MPTKSNDITNPILTKGEMIRVIGTNHQYSGIALKVAAQVTAIVANRGLTKRSSYLMIVEDTVKKHIKALGQQKFDLKHQDEMFSNQSRDASTLTDEEIEDLHRQAGGHWESHR